MRHSPVLAVSPLAPLTAVLAGFVLVAAVVALIVKGSPRKAVNQALGVIPLVSAFASLVAAAIAYGNSVAVPVFTVQGNILALAASVCLATSGLMLLYSLLILIRGVESNDYATARLLGLTSGILGGFSTLFAPVLMLLPVWAGVWNHVVSAPSEGRSGLGVLSVVVFLLVVVLGITFHMDRNGRGGRSRRMILGVSLYMLVCALSILGVLVALSALALSAWFRVSGIRGVEPPSDLLPLLMMLAAVAIAVATSYASSRTAFASAAASLKDRAATSASRSATPGSKEQDVGGSGRRVGEPASGIRSGARQSREPEPPILDRLTPKKLRQRSVDIFPQGYLMNISIIQGVALSVLVQSTVSEVNRGAQPLLPVLAQGLLVLVGLITVSYEYLWFSTIMRWAPTVRDTAIPMLLGVAEIVPGLLIGHPVAWPVSFAAFAFIGGAAFMNTVTRLHERMFTKKSMAHDLVRTLLVRLAGLAGIAGCLSVGVALGSYWFKDTSYWLMIGGCGVLITSLSFGVMGYSEYVINEVYHRYGLTRRSHWFEEAARRRRRR